MVPPTQIILTSSTAFKVKYSDEKIKTRVNQFLSDVLDDRKYNVDKARRLSGVHFPDGHRIPILPHAEFGQNDHQKDVTHFENIQFFIFHDS